MITQSDWRAVHEQQLASDRHSLGDPPTYEEVQAYLRGELSPENEERVRALLVAYPELARAVSEPFPEDDASDQELISDDELAHRWSLLEDRIDGARTNVVQFPRTWMAVAASLVLVFAGLYWNSTREVQRLRTELHVVPGDMPELRPGVTRGGGEEPTTLVPAGDVYPVAVPLTSATYEHFRIQIVDGTGRPREVTEVFRRPMHSSVALLIPRELLPPGNYDVIVFGVDGAHEERLTIYPILVQER